MTKAENPKDCNRFSALIKGKLKRNQKHRHAKAYVNSNILIEDADISFLIRRSSHTES